MKTWTTIAFSLLLAGSVLPGRAFAADLVLYDALDFAGPVAKAFEAKTGLKVDVVEPGSTAETIDKISAEASNPQFDLVWIDGTAVMQRMLKDKVLQSVPDAAYGSANFNALGKTLVPVSHAYLPTSASTTAIEVNTKKVPADQMPKSWGDMTKFAGFVAAKDPNLSGPAYQWLAGLFQTNGVDAGKDLLKAALTRLAFAGLSSGSKVNKAIVVGQAKLGINQDSSIYSKAAGGDPVVAIYPSEGSVALPQGLGVAANTAHMDAVMKFIAFVTSAEGQAAMQDGDDTDFYFIPVIDGVQAKGGRKTDINFVVLNDETAAVHEAEWKQWYKDNFTKKE